MGCEVGGCVGGAANSEVHDTQPSVEPPSRTSMCCRVAIDQRAVARYRSQLLLAAPSWPCKASLGLLPQASKAAHTMRAGIA